MMWRTRTCKCRDRAVKRAPNSNSGVSDQPECWFAFLSRDTCDDKQDTLLHPSVNPMCWVTHVKYVLSGSDKSP